MLTTNKLLLFVGIPILFLLITLAGKSTTTIFRPYIYDCNKQENNPQYETYQINKSNYVSECLNKLKEIDPKRFLRYSKPLDMEVESSFAMSLANHECETEWNKLPDNFMKMTPPQTITIKTTCEGQKLYECISFFGKCIFVTDPIIGDSGNRPLSK